MSARKRWRAGEASFGEADARFLKPARAGPRPAGQGPRQAQGHQLLWHEKRCDHLACESRKPLRHGDRSDAPARPGAELFTSTSARLTDLPPLPTRLSKEGRRRWRPEGTLFARYFFYPGALQGCAGRPGDSDEAAFRRGAEGGPGRALLPWSWRAA